MMHQPVDEMERNDGPNGMTCDGTANKIDLNELAYLFDPDNENWKSHLNSVRVAPMSEVLDLLYQI